MASGVIFRVGGALDPSYRGALAQSVAEAKAAGAQIEAQQTRVRRSMLLPSNQIYGGQAFKFLQANELLEQKKTALLINQNTIRDAIDKKYQAYKIAQAAAFAAQGQTLFAQTMEDRQKIVERAARAEAIALARASQIAATQAIVTGAAGSAGGHGHGSITGIIRESLVVVREVVQGRGMGRIGGSITLLAQYLGLLNKAVKSSAAEQVVAAAAAQKLNVQMAIQALAAKGTAAETELLAASQAQAAITTEALKDEEVALATATVTLNPLFFVIAGAIALVGGGALYAWFHFRRLAAEAKNLADALNPLKRQFTELAESQDKAAKAAQENQDYLAELLDGHTSESEALAEKIKLLHEEAEMRRKAAKDRGASAAELQNLDEQALKKERDMLLVEQARLKTARDKAVADEKAASAADTTGATGKDFTTSEMITANQAAEKAKTLGEIADAAIAAMNEKKIGVGPQYSYAPGSQYPTLVSPATARAANENDKVDFKVGTKEYSMTTAEAKKNFTDANAQSQRLEADQKKLDDALKNSKSTLKEIQDAYQNVGKDLDDVNGRIRNRDENPETRRGHAARTATERERVGIGAPQVANLQKQSLEVSKLQLAEARRLNSNINKLISSGNGPNNPDGW